MCQLSRDDVDYDLSSFFLPSKVRTFVDVQVFVGVGGIDSESVFVVRKFFSKRAAACFMPVIGPLFLWWILSVCLCPSSSAQGSLNGSLCCTMLMVDAFLLKFVRVDGSVGSPWCFV